MFRRCVFKGKQMYIFDMQANTEIFITRFWIFRYRDYFIVHMQFRCAHMNTELYRGIRGFGHSGKE